MLHRMTVVSCLLFSVGLSGCGQVGDSGRSAVDVSDPFDDNAKPSLSPKQPVANGGGGISGRSAPMNEASHPGKPTEATDPKDFKAGFRELSWGDRVTSGFEKLAPFEEAPGSHVYRRGSDELAIGEYPLDSIFYVFDKEETFRGVWILASNDSVMGVATTFCKEYRLPDSIPMDPYDVLEPGAFNRALAARYRALSTELAKLPSAGGSLMWHPEKEHDLGKTTVAVHVDPRGGRGAIMIMQFGFARTFVDNATAAQKKASDAAASRSRQGL